jgi:FkbM family methyltransferase
MNLKYDRLSKLIIKNYLNNSSNCIDIGCHKGEILELLIKKAPNGIHFGFEPLPNFYSDLKKKFSSKKINILPYALGDENKEVVFHYVKNAPAYSGLKKRDYDKIKPDIEQIKVQQKRLDDCISENTTIDFIKIDVEGAEFQVLKGAQRILKNNKPLILFEFGMGASNFYGTKPKDLFEFLNDVNYNIYTLDDFVDKKNPLTIEKFSKKYESNEEYYFVAK